MKKINKYKHIVYIDESNISVSIGHSVYCATFVIYTNKDKLSEEIISIEHNLKIKYLHWVNMPWKLRERFAEKIKNFNFLCKYVLYKNPINQEVILEDFISKIINVDDGIYKILIDGKKGINYTHKIKKNLKSKGVNINKLIFIDDKNEPLIRLTDFLAGLIRSNLDTKNAYSKYMYNILKHKIKIPD